jgi:excisionase family DNA binding protein
MEAQMITEAARRLGISDQSARLALVRGELRGFRIGRSWRVHPESIERLMADHGGENAA